MARASAGQPCRAASMPLPPAEERYTEMFGFTFTLLSHGLLLAGREVVRRGDMKRDEQERKSNTGRQAWHTEECRHIRGKGTHLLIEWRPAGVQAAVGQAHRGGAHLQEAGTFQEE